MPLIPMALLLAYYQNRQKTGILETHYNLAEVLSSNIDYYVTDVSRRLAFTARLDALEKETEAQQLLRTALDYNPDFAFLALLGPDGRETAYALPEGNVREGGKVDLSRDKNLPALALDKRLHLTALATEDGNATAEFLYPLASGGFLYGVLNFNDLLERLGQMRVGRTGQIYLASAAGEIYRAPYQWDPYVKTEELAECFAGKSRLIKDLKGKDGSYAGAFSFSAPLGVYVTVLQPKEEAMRSVYFSNTVIVLFLLAIATLAWFGALAFSRSLGEPIAALAEGAREVSRGNLEHRVNEDAGWGEFQELIASFNGMTADLKDYQVLQLKSKLSEMKEQVFRAVAHDLRAPLLGLQGYIYILSSGKISEEERREYLQRMTEAARNLSSLLEDVLSVSRVETGMTLPKRQRVELEPFLQSILHEQEPVAKEKGLRLSCKTQPGASAWADPKLLRRMVTNLLSNALKFTREGFVEVSAASDHNGAVVSVQDSGIGLTEKQCGEIFEKYRQVSDGAEGYGLGLFISRQLARAHGGDLTVASAPGKGSTFTLHLPEEEQ